MDRSRALLRTVVAVAQLVEPWIVIPVVVGSSPISHPIYSLRFSVLPPLFFFSCAARAVAWPRSGRAT